jgi:O-antigen ligase
MLEYLYVSLAIVIGLITWFYKPKIAFCIAPFMFNLDNFSVVEGKSISFIFFAVAFFGLMMRYFLLKPKIRTRLIYILFIFCFYIMIGSLFRYDLILSLIKVISLSGLIFFFLASINNHRDLQQIVISFAVSGFITALLYITWGPGLQNLFSGEIDRSSFLAWNVNNIALQWAAAFIIALIYSMSAIKYNRILFIVMAFVCCLASLGTLSRGITLALMVASIFLLIIGFAWKLRLVILTAALTLLVMTPTNLIIRFQEIDYDKFHRILIWEETMELIGDNLFFGVGEGSGFLEAGIGITSKYASAFYAHNSYLQSAANWGLPAGILFLLLILITLGTLFFHYLKLTKLKVNNPQPLFLSIIGCLIIYSVAIIFLSREGAKDLYFVLGFCWTYLSIENKNKTTNSTGRLRPYPLNSNFHRNSFI